MKKILLVDDSNTSLLMTRTILARLRAVRIYVANDGKEAIDKALLHLPDVILMDVEMPVMDGFEATLCLGENPATRHIPVIMLTTRTEITNINRGFDCGCADYLAKPVKIGPLLESLKRVLK
jgi:CheY-like chemotaxis protein